MTATTRSPVTPDDQPTDRGTRATGIAAACIAVLAWSVGPLGIKLSNLGGIEFAVWRVWVGFALMAILARASGQRWWADVRSSLPGGVMFGAYIVLFFSAVKATSIADATLITSLAPVMVVVVAGRWFGEYVSRRQFLATGVAIAGAALVSLGGSTTAAWSLAGDLLAVGALVGWTAYFLHNKRARTSRGAGAVSYQTGVLLGAALVLTPVGLASALLREQTSFVPHGTDWLALLFVAAVPGVLGHSLMTWAHRYVDVTLSSLLVLAQPVLAAIVALIALEEPLALLQVIGGGIVIGSIGVASVPARTPDLAEAPAQ